MATVATAVAGVGSQVRTLARAPAHSCETIVATDGGLVLDAPFDPGGMMRAARRVRGSGAAVTFASRGGRRSSFWTLLARARLVYAPRPATPA